MLSVYPFFACAHVLHFLLEFYSTMIAGVQDIPGEAGSSEGGQSLRGSLHRVQPRPPASAVPGAQTG